jgi:TPR repeat protein
MPEVPSNMQEELAHLELEAREVQPDRISSMSSVSSQGPYSDHRHSKQVAPTKPLPQQPDVFASNLYSPAYENTNAALYENAFSHGQGQPTLPIEPSPFPKLHNPGPKIPCSDSEKEAILESRRPLVLTSSNPDMQLAWAQDALLWADNAIQSRLRLSDEKPARPGTPQVEKQIRTDAISIVNFLADQHHPKALFLRATWYEFGKFDYPVSRDEAHLGYKRAAQRGYARAEYRLGTQCEAKQDMARAIMHYTAGISMGDATSNYRMGMMSLLGQHGQARDYELGVRRIRYAAEMADENAAQGAYVYGMLLANELPNITVPESVLPSDIEQARGFMEKAAFLGFAKAQLKMGSAYELCLLGCDFDPALSLHYNALAAHQGEAEADMAISKWFLCGFEGIFEKNEELAFTYARRAARAGLPTAEFAMGYFYEIGMYAPSDLRQAQMWYKTAAGHGNKDAAGRLESISQQKTLSKKDHEQVAITRIKSQYGSQRGKRPDRFKEKPVPLPPTVEIEERVDMPDPNAARNSVSSPVFMIAPPESFPPARPISIAPYPDRPKSTAPYPEEDVYPTARPKSTAPYPEDDFPSSRYSQVPTSGYRNSQLHPQQGPTADRPLSAFGIRPAHLQAQDHRGQLPLRPSTSMSNMQAVPDGRGNNPAGRHGVVSAGWESQPSSTYRQPSPNGPIPNRNPLPPFEASRPQSSHAPQASPNVGRNKLQKLAPNIGKPQPALPQHLTPDPGYPVTPVAPLNIQRKSPTPAPASQTRYDEPHSSATNSSRPNTMQPPMHDARSTLPSNNGGRRSDRVDSLPPAANRAPQKPSLPHSSSAPNNLQQRIPSGQQPTIPVLPPKTSSAAQSTASLPPPRTSSAAPSTASVSSKQSTGPKTFDEMGIPSQKNESDCVSSAT